MVTREARPVSLSHVVKGNPTLIRRRGLGLSPRPAEKERGGVCAGSGVVGSGTKELPVAERYVPA